MRSGSYLVEKGFIKSLHWGKRGVKNGLARVARETKSESVFNSKFKNKVDSHRVNKPVRYWKLKKLLEEFNVIKRSDVVLDIGSGMGSFLLCASENCREVYGMEFSIEFRSRLDSIEEELKGRVKVIYEDAFCFDFKKEL